MKRAWLAVVVLLAAASPLFGQYGVIVHGVAGQGQLTVGESIRLVGTACGSLRPEIGADEARAILQKLGVKLPAGADDSPVTFGGYAYLVTQLFDLRGSVGYGLFPGPRSAFSELQERGLIPAGARSGYPVSGADALLLLRRVIEARGASR